LSTLFTALLLGEMVNATQFIWVIILVLGAIITSLDWRKVISDGLDKNDFTKGLGWIILTLLLHAIYFPTLADFTAGNFWYIKLLGIKLVVAGLLIFIFRFLRRSEIKIKQRNIALYTVFLGFLEVIGWLGLSWASTNSEGLTAFI